ncbi:MAG: DUF4340 domain-containing protein [Gammaproteobacteria bacterium]|nr:DUF4340 domain-containing protein [Gammaproteobacteria bacterium]
MNNRLWLNSLLALGALVLGIVYFAAPDDQDHEARYQNTTSLQAEDVQRIRLQRRDEDDIVLRRRDSAWRIESPLSLPANPKRVETLLQLLRQEHHGRFTRDQVKLHEIGLDNPRVAVQYDDLRMAFGHTDPLSRRRYVLIQDQVYLLEDRHFADLVAQLDAYIDLRLLRDGEQLVSLKLPEIKLLRGEEGWRLQSAHQPNSGDDILRLIQTWQTASALEVEAQDTLNASPTGVIELGLEQAPPIRLQIIRRHPDLILWRPDLGLRYHFTPHQARQMLELSPDRD